MRYKIVIAHGLRLPPEYNYLASASGGSPRTCAITLTQVWAVFADHLPTLTYILYTYHTVQVT